MATRSYLERPSYIYLGHDEKRQQNQVVVSSPPFEFDESDVWNNNPTNNPGWVVVPSDQQPRNPIPKKPAKRGSSGGGVDRRPLGVAASLPVNIPDWSKILHEDDGGNHHDDDDDDDQEERMPPHEYLARTRAASLSVHEGIGRTLKGRDLSRVRNAIWKQIGFED